MTNVKATGELLCELLDVRGIAWKKRRGYIRWSKKTKYGVTHYQAWPCFDGTVTLTVRDEYAITPEQAVASTCSGSAEDIKKVRELVGAQAERISEMRNELDRLIEKGDKLTERCFELTMELEKRDKGIKRLKRRRDELTSTSAELQRKLDNCAQDLADSERLREELSETLNEIILRRAYE